MENINIEEKRTEVFALANEIDEKSHELKKLIEVNPSEALLVVNAINEKSEELLKAVSDLKSMEKNMNQSTELNQDTCEHIWFKSAFGHDEGDYNFKYQYTCVKCQKQKILSKDCQSMVDVTDDNKYEYYIDVTQNPEYMFAVYKTLKQNNKMSSNFEAATLLESFIKTYENSQDKSHFARTFKVDENVINQYRGYGE